MNTQANTSAVRPITLQYAIMGVDARYSISFTIDDISLVGTWALHLSGKWLGNADSRADAVMSAQLHASIFDGATLHQEKRITK